jgi:hypothetical protein
MPTTTEQQFPSREFLEALPPRAAELFAPRPWPADDMLVVLRLIANEGGIPRKCPDPRCRRSRCCQAEDIGEDGPPCGALWPDDEVRRLHGAMEGLGFAWQLAETRSKQIREAILPPAAKAAQESQPGRRRKRREG